ncbi:MAG: 6-phosphogluconolactonase [Actinomyces ruminicola]|uniref:6-phosphogluconolactonase n=1 Tax=Actinomyces ruminicola TaxID=332524 RepID=A0A1G9UL20_9ACTO|nr:6-phosphogluconolactonase [Actinomyces ruminicola]MBE6482084.1 6-phosphogluconolactonase [Actinomyces ruminicola]SDM60553.1 6-phosphogluconolactonase [Actinomyces ruminicola]
MTAVDAGSVNAAAAALPAPTAVVHDTLAEAAAVAAAQTARLLADAVADRGAAHLSLTGGSGGEALAAALPGALAAAGLIPGAGLDRLHLWEGDERFVAADDADRNDLLAAGLVSAGVPEANVHRLRGPERTESVDASAAALAEELREHGPADGRFDVIHLGLGPDAHVCSLFPGHPAAPATGTDVIAVHDSPKPPPERVSFSFDVLHRARHVMVVAGGAGKAEAVAKGLGTPDVVAAPASCARGEVTFWHLDRAAAAGAPT